MVFSGSHGVGSVVSPWIQGLITWDCLPSGIPNVQETQWAEKGYLNLSPAKSHPVHLAWGFHGDGKQISHAVSSITAVSPLILFHAKYPDVINGIGRNEAQRWEARPWEWGIGVKMG